MHGRATSTFVHGRATSTLMVSQRTVNGPTKGSPNYPVRDGRSSSNCPCRAQQNGGDQAAGRALPQREYHYTRT
eukprot:355607-Chlamydomonas_euryale.AAC.3